LNENHDQQGNERDPEADSDFSEEEDIVLEPEEDKSKIQNPLNSL